ncbi:MAG TPA: hypothetical protein VFG86_06315 [Chloroflexota bacterium]|jgi:antibiotic biosynthesis monooxygenase (ABM) superfamily enzyme|nr:hypothetical protein [Chloroflexota bacterium]
MWDWYTRPGGLRRVPTWKIALVVTALACAVTVALWLLYAALAPLLFTRVPG